MPPASSWWVPRVQAVDNLPALAPGVPVVDMSSSGTVVYAPTTAMSRLVWVSRGGTEEPLNDVLRVYMNPRVSPDGSRAVVQAGDLWIQDLARATFTRLPLRDVVSGGFPAWTSDGRRVVYRTTGGLRFQDAYGGGQSEGVSGTSESDYPTSVTPDGETLVFMRSSQATSLDIYAVGVRDPGKARPIVETAAYEGGARVSPNGR